MTRPAALAAVRAVLKRKKEKTPFPNAANITVASFIKQKGKTTQHSGGVAPRYHLASGPALMAKAPSLVFGCGMSTVSVGVIVESVRCCVGVNDLVLLGSRDLSGGLGGLSSLSAHIGTLGETAELCRMLVCVG